MNKSRTYLEFTKVYLVLGLLFLCYAVYALNGYGNDDDTYRMLSTWRFLITEHRYVPSRFQGNLIPELAMGLASQIGGFFLSNLVSVTLSIASLFIFYLLLIKFTTPLIAILAVMTVGSNPYWIISSTTSIDYIYAIFFFLLGIFTLITGRLRIAGLVFALAVSSRITYGPIVVLAFLFYFPYVNKGKPGDLKLFVQAVVLFFLGTAVLYLPVFIASGMNLSFLRFVDGSKGGFLGMVARYFYKNIYFWGLPTFIVVLTFFYKERSYYFQRLATNPFANSKIRNLLFHAAFWCLIYNEIMFFRLPHEYGYLLPVLLCAVYLITILSSTSKKVRILSIIFALNIIYSVICNFDILETYQTEGIGQTIHSDGAYLNFSVKPGILVRDAQWRNSYQEYQFNEFNKFWKQKGF